MKKSLVSTLSAAAFALTALAACGNDNSNSATTATPSPSASASVSASADDHSASAAPSADAVAPSVPDGYKLVTAPKNGISFAIPDGWFELDSSAVANSEEFRDAIEQYTAGLNMTTEDFLKQMAQFDLMASALTPDGTVTENLNVNAQVLPVTSLPTEDDLKQLVESAQGTADVYSTTTTPLGEGAIESYTLTVGEVTVHGAFILVPVPNGGYALVTVTAADADRVSTLADAITSSVQAAK